MCQSIKAFFVKYGVSYSLKIIFLFALISCLFPSSSTAQSIEELRIKALKAKEDKDWASLVINYCDMGYANWEAEKFMEMGNHIDTALIIARKHQLTSFGEAYATIWNYYGFFYQEMGRYEKALQAFEQVLKIDTVLVKKDSSFEKSYLGSDYQNIGAVLSKLGDYKRALEYYNFAFQYLPEKNETAVTTKINIGLDFEKQKQYKKARKFYCDASRTLNQISQDNRVRFLKILALKSLAYNFYLDSKPDSSFVYLNKSRKLIKPHEKNELADYFIGLAHFFSSKKQYSKAIKNLKKGLNLRSEKFTKKHPLVGGVYLSLGELYFKQNNPIEALNYYQQALTSLVWEFNDSTAFNKNPSLQDNISDKIGLLEILAKKGASLNLLLDKENAKKTYLLALNLVDKIKNNYQTEESKYVLLEKSMSIYEAAIQLAIELNDQKLALQLMERSKATLLLENLKSTEAQAFAGIPNKLLEKERELKTNIAFYERKLADNLINNRENYIKKNNQTLFLLRQEKQTLIHQLEKEYPKYFQLKYSQQYASIKDIQQNLVDKKTALLEYFVGDKHVYVFVITSNEIKNFIIPKEIDFEEQINSLTKAISLPNTTKEAFFTFTDAAYTISVNYFKPLINQINKSIDQLIIIPDRQLSYVPFQSLILNPVSNENYAESRYDTLSYLVNKYAITYGYSSTLLLNKVNTANQNATMEFGGFAPVFEDQIVASIRGGNLGKLKYSEQEIKTLNQLMKGRIFLKGEATVSNFQAAAAQFRILHLSTHASADNNPINTKIYFRDDYLTVKDIYNIPINADLAVLSACETGIGKLQEGEGIISLERAFMYAGCPSLVTSLWQVDDKKTSSLMIDFYKSLKKGRAKHIALQKAQTNYLTHIQSTEAAHPFYWAAFILTGTQAPIFSNPFWANHLSLINLILLIALVGFIGWRKFVKSV